MTIGHVPHEGLDCPLCPGTLETWGRGNLLVEFCDQCSALFLDRGELFQLFRSEGYNCPPEAHLRLSFSPEEGEVLGCPKCQSKTLVPGRVQGVEIWHCTPCNGFLVERGLLLGEAKAHHVPLHLQGFRRQDATAARRDDARVADYVGRVIGRLASWARGTG